jgi:hypothetical protein
MKGVDEMSERKRDGEAEQDSGVRAGGDVQTKGPSKDASTDQPTTRAGGDVQTKGPSKDVADSGATPSE